jgi:hypothetical protein
MPPHPSLPPPPWNEVLRACAAGELHQSAFGFRVVLTTHRLEPRNVGVVLSSGRRSTAVGSVYVCPCGAFVLGERDSVVVDDLATANGASRFLELLLPSIRELRSELAPAAASHLRTIGAELHAQIVLAVAVHATRWNLPPYALLGRTRARPSECWHRR